ncbi:MAG: 2-succinyl-5-enolpyruvyl-6-hydroxy-3-cyclohexene-1-carboxylic-acid synthase [Anditalea sp.]
MILQPIIDLAAICAKKGIKNVILSPGSRCAPITLAFVRHPEIHCRTIADERSAAFIALGMAQQLEKPVVLVCTSGSAALNYAPAVAEAFFQQIPLIVITADRPAEWIDQWDGQTIRQENSFGKHIKADFTFPDEFSHPDKIWHAQRITNEAINKAGQYPCGPVHLNIPLREPFYPENEEIFSFKNKPRVFDEIKGIPVLSDDSILKLKTSLEKYRRILIVPGQQRPNPEITTLLNKIIQDKKAVVVTDVISNLQSDHSITYHDHFLQVQEDQSGICPDLIISFGKSIISKSLKLFLRKSEAAHWHIQPNGYVPDTYQRLDKKIQTHPSYLLKLLDENLQATDESFYDQWKNAEEKLMYHFPQIMEQADFGEYKAIHECLKHLPSPSKIHLSNSMPVRYVNFIGIKDSDQEVICNRGTSGIDGSNSTAIGCTFTTKEPVVLITGDMAFFYDRNAFWHNYSLPNLRIILLNNHAGGIFRLIEGPSRQPELEEFFETKQKLNADFLAQEHGFEYALVEDEVNLKEILKNFYHPSVRPKILEITSESKKNAQILQQIKAAVKQVFEI